MKWIDAKQKVNIIIFDEQTEERMIETMTIEEILDAYTDEGCPEGISNLENDWTPCSKGLPAEDGKYLVTDDAGGTKEVYEDDFWILPDIEPMWIQSQNVTAWMPLPEPYKEGEQDE